MQISERWSRRFYKAPDETPVERDKRLAKVVLVDHQCDCEGCDEARELLKK